MRAGRAPVVWGGASFLFTAIFVLGLLVRPTAELPDTSALRVPPTERGAQAFVAAAPAGEAPGFVAAAVAAEEASGGVFAFDEVQGSLPAIEALSEIELGLAVFTRRPPRVLFTQPLFVSTPLVEIPEPPRGPPSRPDDVEPVDAPGKPARPPEHAGPSEDPDPPLEPCTDERHPKDRRGIGKGHCKHDERTH